MLFSTLNLFCIYSYGLTGPLSSTKLFCIFQYTIDIFRHGQSTFYLFRELNIQNIRKILIFNENFQIGHCKNRGLKLDCLESLETITLNLSRILLNNQIDLNDLPHLNLGKSLARLLVMIYNG